MDFKVKTMNGIVFKQLLDTLGTKEKQIATLRETMDLAIRHMVIKQYSNEKGEVLWKTTVKEAVDTAKKAIDMNVGAAVGYQAGFKAGAKAKAVPAPPVAVAPVPPVAVAVAPAPEAMVEG